MGLSLFVVLLIVGCIAKKENIKNKELVNKILTNKAFNQVKDKAIEVVNPTCSFYPLKTTKYPQNNKISTNFTVFKNLYS